MRADSAPPDNFPERRLLARIDIIEHRGQRGDIILRNPPPSAGDVKLALPVGNT